MAQRYCKREHDTDLVGRVQRMCRECRRMNDRARYQRRTRRTSWIEGVVEVLIYIPERMIRWVRGRQN